MGAGARLNGRCAITCLHEAGHAVAALLLGRRPVRAEVEEDGEGEAGEAAVWTGQAGQEKGGVGWLLEEVTICLAGEASVFLASRSRRGAREGCEQDYRNARELLAALGIEPGSRESKRQLKRLAAEALALLSDRRTGAPEALKRIARALWERGRLDDAELRSLAGQAVLAHAQTRGIDHLGGL